MSPGSLVSGSVVLARALRLECLGHRETVFVDVVSSDKAVFDCEVQGEPCAVGASGGPGGLADLAEHDRIVAVYEDALDLGGCGPGTWCSASSR